MNEFYKSLCRVKASEQHLLFGVRRCGDQPATHRRTDFILVLNAADLGGRETPNQNRNLQNADDHCPHPFGA